LDAITLNTAVIPTKLQESGQLDLSGEADIHNLSIEQDETNHELNTKKVTASKEISHDFGENAIIKPPTNGVLTPHHKLKLLLLKYIRLKILH